MPEMVWVYSLRFHHGQPANKEMYHGFDKDTGMPIVVRTNEDGFRSDYSREAFTKHTTRIVVQGDSFAFGFLVPQGDAVPQVLEKELRQKGVKDVAVLNAGIVSYSPFLNRLMFDSVLKQYYPTLVLMILDLSDIGDDHEYSGCAVEDEHELYFKRSDLSAWMEEDPKFWECSALYQRLYWPLLILRRLVFRPVAAAFSDPSPDLVHGIEIEGTVEKSRYFILRHPLEKTRKYFERTLANIIAVSESAAAIGAGFVLVVAPRFHHWNPMECPANWETVLGSYSLDEPYQYEYFRFFEQAQGRVKFPIFNLLPTFKATKEYPLVFSFDPHWNKRGHRVAAEAISEYLTENGLVE
jgi:hypothetical protein